MTRDVPARPNSADVPLPPAAPPRAFSGLNGGSEASEIPGQPDERGGRRPGAGVR
jgi:hypothetical protein